MAKKRKDEKGRILRTNESQRPDGLYMYRYKDAWGKVKYAYASNLSDLRDKEREIQRDLEDGIVTGNKVTLNQFLDHYLSLKAKQLAYSTLQNYRYIYDKDIRAEKLGNKRLEDVIKSDIIMFYQKLQDRGLKFVSIKKYDDLLSPCFDLAVEDNLIRVMAA